MGVLQPDNACGQGTTWDEASQTCVVANPSDTDFDGCVGMTDLLNLLSSFGTCFDDEAGAWSCGDPLEYQGYDYETVQIGEQCWFAENLRALSFNNGDEVHSGLSSLEWSSTSEAALAIYPGNPGGEEASYEVYGALYNWHAVEDERGICPANWHVPTDNEWSEMTESIGGASVAGVKMRATSGWEAWEEGGNGTNESGFSGLPGGTRLEGGGFSSGDYFGYWWTSSLTNQGTAWLRELDGVVDHVIIDPNGGDKNIGVSIRCIQDSEQ